MILFKGLLLFLAAFMKIEQHGIPGRLIPNDVALLIMDPRTRAPHKAAAEKDLSNKDADQPVRVLHQFFLIFILFVVIVIVHYCALLDSP